MAELGRAALKAFFETGDKPTEAQFADFIDSYFNFIDNDTIDLLQTLYSSATQTKVILDNDSTASIVFDTAGGGMVHIAPDSGTLSFAKSFLNLESGLCDVGFDFTFLNADQFDLKLQVTDVVATSTKLMHHMRNNGGSFEQGWFAHLPAAQQVVIGSRGGNAALASLLTALDNYGLIVDSTTP